MAVTKGSSSLGRLAGGCGYERVVYTWTTSVAGVVSDTFSPLAGQVVEAITIPGTCGIHTCRLRDPNNSDIDYLCGSLAAINSDAVTYWAPMISDARSYRAPVVAGDCQFHISDVAGASDLTGSVVLFLKT